MKTDNNTTEAAKRRYNRVAPIYDPMEWIVERSHYSRWRELLWTKVVGNHILEVGVGTGKNFPYYPKDTEITAIDFSHRMLQRARDKASRQNMKVHLEQMDVQHLKFNDNSFDTVVASFVFCSVPDPIRGLTEVQRVCKSGGKVILLEHVLSANRILGWIMNLTNPFVVRVVGANINRKTVENVINSGLTVEQVTDLAAGIFKLIEARKQ